MNDSKLILTLCGIGNHLLGNLNLLGSEYFQALINVGIFLKEFFFTVSNNFNKFLLTLFHSGVIYFKKGLLFGDELSFSLCLSKGLRHRLQFNFGSL
jgi:hypothetical protein